MTYKMSHPDDWTLVRKLMAVESTTHMSNQRLYSWCQEQGICVDQLAAWTLAFSHIEDDGSNAVKATLKDLRRALTEASCGSS